MTSVLLPPLTPHPSYPDCGRQAGRSLQAEVYERIHVRGCLTVVGRALQDHVMPLLLAWGLLGLLVALAELMLLALCLLAYRLVKHRGHAKPRQDCIECDEEKQNTLIIINKAAKKLLWKETMRKEYYEQLV